MKKNNALSHLFYHSYEAERNLRHFSAASSGELATLLANVVGELDYALTLTDPEARQLAIHRALAAAERAINTTRNLKYFAASTRLELRATDLSQLVLDTVDQIEGLFNQSGIQFNVVVDSGIHAVLDASAFSQAISNLLWFSYFSLPQGGKLTVAMQVSSTKMEISVGHNGTGYLPEQAEKLFDAYGNDKSGSEQTLGLAVTKAIIESHGGEVAAHSSPGKGTNFFLTLPYRPKDQKRNLFAEKRRHRRVPVSLAAEVTLVGNRSLRSTVTTLSAGGCFVGLPLADLKEMPSVDSKLSLKLFCQGNELVVVTEARVASVVPTDSHLGLGIEFLQLDARGQKLIRALVKSQG